VAYSIYDTGKWFQIHEVYIYIYILILSLDSRRGVGERHALAALPAREETR